MASLGLRQSNHTSEVCGGGSHHARSQTTTYRPDAHSACRPTAAGASADRRPAAGAPGTDHPRQAASGANNDQIATLLGIDRGTVRTWRMRWLEALPRLKAAEKRAGGGGRGGGDDDDDERVVSGLVEEVLVDEPRSGKPATFTPEQICQIVALACEEPREESGRPISHWSTTELADEAIKRGIVESISARSVGRFLGRGGSSEASSGTPLET